MSLAVCSSKPYFFNCVWQNFPKVGPRQWYWQFGQDEQDKRNQDATSLSFIHLWQMCSFAERRLRWKLSGPCFTILIDCFHAAEPQRPQMIMHAGIVKQSAMFNHMNIGSWLWLHNAAKENIRIQSGSFFKLTQSDSATLYGVKILLWK